MKDAFWGQIFGLLSAGGATIETIHNHECCRESDGRD